MKRVEIINPKNEHHIEAMNDFCLRNDLPNVAKYLLKEKSFSIASPVFTTYLAFFEQEEVKDYCEVQGETDIKRCFVSFPPVFDWKNKNRPFVEKAIDTLFGMGMETIFVNTDDTSLKSSLEKIGFMSLGTDKENYTDYALGREERMRPVYETFKAK